jgi:hypothetical protein
MGQVKKPVFMRTTVARETDTSALSLMMSASV